MKVISRKTFRKKGLLVLVPLVFMFLLLVATSGQVAVGAHYAPSYNVPPPGPFPPAPMATGDNDGDSVQNYDGYVDVAELLGTGYLGDPGNQGSVHIIDVRSSFEYLADVCPMQIALGMPVYPTTNVGHPAWNWADPADTSPAAGTQYEEAYSNPYWIGFYFAGSPGVPKNIRMEENPDFHSYFMAMVADGIGEPGDTLVILCQTGYRASFAAMELKKLNTMYSLGISEIVVLYGGELAWRDDWSLDDSPLNANCDANDTSDPSPDDDPDNPSMPPYFTPVPWPNGTWKDCDPDNVPGPSSLGYTNTLTAPYKYDAPGQLGTSYAWNGTEPHVAVKPWWQDYMGSPPGSNPAGDSMLSLSINSVGWASWSDYSSVPSKLSVSYKLTNNAPMDVTPTWPMGSSPEDILPFPYYMNYDDSCTGYGAAGSGCEAIGQASHGNAYNSMIVDATATNGVTPVTPMGYPGTPLAYIGAIAPTSNGSGTVKYNIPSGTGSFMTTVYAKSTDLPDPSDAYPDGYNDPFHEDIMCAAFGSCAAPSFWYKMGWYGVYSYPGPAWWE